MKKLLLAALWLPLMALAQSYPSPTFNNVTVNGTLTGKVNSTGSTITNATITGGTISGLSSPLPVASGGTNSASASGAALDNISGFASTGFMSRTGAGAYSFTASTGSGSVVLGTSPSIATPTITGSLTATGLVTTADLATQAANTVLANATGSSASPTAFAMPSCSTSTSALQWTSSTGFTCYGNSASLTGATFIGSLLAGYTNATIAANDTSGTGIAKFAFQSNGALVWDLLKGGGSTGNFFLERYNPAGTYVDNPISVSNSTGLVTFADGLSSNSSGNAITGGAINNATIGATTPSTGAFTVLSASTSNPSLNYLSSGTSAVARTYTSKYGDVVSVKDFGAKGDGSTNDTAAITAADTYARSIGARLYFPAGTYMVSQLVVNTNTNWQGDGRNQSIIKQIIGSNTDLIYGVNSNSNWGSATPSGYAVGYTIRDLTFNGNWNTGSGNTSGSCLAVYGPRPILENLFITNCPLYGMRTEYTDSSNGGDDTFTMEGHVDNVRIDTTGEYGWWNNGPHDTVAIDVVVVDAGQATTNSWDGFYYDAKSTGRNIGLHAWTRAASNRMRYALNIQPGAQHEFSGGCNFEGAYSANLALFSSFNIFDPSTRFYAAWNGVDVYMGKTATLNTIYGWLGAPGGGQPASEGIVLGSASGDDIADNTIILKSISQESTNVAFSAFDLGDNRIRIETYNTTAASISGTPNTSDDIDILVHNSGGTSHINNRFQCGQITTGASASGTWTYPYAFAAAPIVTFSPQGPGGSLTSGMWISSVSSTSVTIFNNNTVSTTANVCARATN